MKYNFEELIKNKSDEELITILTARRGEYTPDLISTAQAEFEIRNISIDLVESVKVKETAIKEKESAIADEPLEDDLKYLAYFSPLIASMAFKSKYKDNAINYERKNAELSNASFKSRLYLIGIIILIAVISSLI